MQANLLTIPARLYSNFSAKLPGQPLSPMDCVNLCFWIVSPNQKCSLSTLHGAVETLKLEQFVNLVPNFASSFVSPLFHYRLLLLLLLLRPPSRQISIPIVVGCGWPNCDCWAFFRTPNGQEEKLLREMLIWHVLNLNVIHYRIRLRSSLVARLQVRKIERWIEPKTERVK